MLPTNAALPSKSVTIRKLRILHTEWSDGWGGQERRVLSEMIGMRERGHHLLLACRKSCRLGAEAELAGIPVVHVPFSGKFHLASIRQLISLIRTEGIDLVNTHSGIDSWVGGIAARRAGVLLVRTRHLNLPLKRNVLNFVHYLPHTVVTCGEAMRKNLIAHGFPEDKVVSIPTGVNFKRFQSTLSRPEARRQLRLPDDVFVILMVGIIRGVKRHEIAIRAFAQFQCVHPSAQLLLAGDGPMTSDMQHLAETLGLGESVKFLGLRDDVPDLLASANCFLLTSRSEGVPQVITQAMGCGVPVISTAVGGVPELIIDGRTGLLVPPESPELIAQALSRLIDDRLLADRLGSEGKAHVEAHYSLQAMLDATEALYGRLLGASA